MLSGADLPVTDKHELFAHLARGHSAGITVVTPNRRLAQTLTREFDERQATSGRTVWESADILPIGAFLERLYEEALYSDIAAQLPLLLTAAQEQLLWEQVVEQSGLLSIAHTATQCRAAWQLCHAWRTGVATVTEDAAAFCSWSSSYEEKTRGRVDAARLPDLLVGLSGRLQKPRQVVAYAFDIMPPQTRAFLDMFAWVCCQPDAELGTAVRISFASGKLELEAAAAWARNRLEQGRASIGVVVPDLRQRRKEVMRVFSRVMQPAGHLPASEKEPLPFNLSLGQPLAEYPLVATALDLLRFSSRRVEFALASRLIRSPFLGAAEVEMTRRARLDASLRRTMDATVTLPELIAVVGDCPALRSLLEAVLLIAESVEQTPGGWARRFSALLDAAGFPGEQALDSDEYQTHARWHETLSELSRLQAVARAMSAEQALAALQGLCNDTLFQPESGHLPIQVLGILESAGLRFDCLWVSGLTDEAWPLAARPNPFIPVALQRRAGIPEASAEGSLELDRRLTDEWRVAAQEVVFSHARQEADHNLAASPLILDVEAGELALPEFPRYRDVLFTHRNLESAVDNTAPRVTVKAVRGGTRVLADQAACPFRAFARWRLHAEALEELAPGLDAADRGRLLHALMRNIWTVLKSSRNLQADLEPVIGAAARAAVEEAGIQGRFAELERLRLARLAREWLELEKTRVEFEISVLEEKRTIALAGLELSGRIDRLDRLDSGAGHVLIDYKTGSMVSAKAWEPPRPDEPQLPLYALGAREDIAAVAFARLRPGGMKYIGVSREANTLPNVKPARDWDGLFALWRTEVEALAGAFAAGDARVDPKNELATCRLCELQTLCRVYEKLNVLQAEEP